MVKGNCYKGLIKIITHVFIVVSLKIDENIKKKKFQNFGSSLEFEKNKNKLKLKFFILNQKSPNNQ